MIIRNYSTLFLRGELSLVAFDPGCDLGEERGNATFGNLVFEVIPLKLGGRYASI